MSARLNPPPESDSGLAKPANPIVADIRSGLYNLPQEMPDPDEQPLNASDLYAGTPTASEPTAENLAHTQAAGLVRRMNGAQAPPVASQLDSPMSIRDGMSLLPTEQQGVLLDEYDRRRKFFLDWLLSHLVEGEHYGFPPGCQPKITDPKQWKAKPSLYKAGALLLTDLLKLKPVYQADESAWKMMGAKEGLLVMRCTLFDRASGLQLGEGHGVYAVGQKGMTANAAIKMAEKCALVGAIINTVPVCGDLFTQDLEPPPPRPSAAADPNAPQAPTRQERADVPKRETPPPAVKPPPANGGDVFASPEWRQLSAILNDPKRGLVDDDKKVKAMINQLGRAVPSGKAGWTIELVREVLAAFTGDPVKAGGYDREAFAPWGNGTPPSEPPEEYV